MRRLLARRPAELRPAYVQLSLDGTRHTHEAVRGAGTYDRVMEAARHLVQAGVATSLSLTAHRGNFREFRKWREWRGGWA